MKRRISSSGHYSIELKKLQQLANPNQEFEIIDILEDVNSRNTFQRS